MNKLRKTLLILFATMTAVFAPLAMNAQTNGNWIDQRETTWGSDYENTSSFTISTAGQLAQLAYMVNNGSSFENKTITLTDYIDLAGLYWTPIGNDDNDFRGSFEGGNKTISNLTINNTAQYQGLFGSLASAFVMNVNLVDCNITAGSFTGGIAGDAGWTTISNCSVSGEIHSAGTSSHNYGGIVGNVSGSSYGNLIIVGNTNTASVSATENGYAVGGIVGYFGRTTKFRNNFSTGVVSGSDYVGTLIGMIDEDDYNEFTNNCYPANANLTGAVGSSDASTGHDIEGASVGFTITAGQDVTISLPDPVKTYNNVAYYMSSVEVSTTGFTVPQGNHFTGYSVNSGSISNAGLMVGSHTLTGATENVTISGTYAEGEPTDFSNLISIEVEDATYDGQAHLQEPVVMMGNTTLTKNVDYAVSYSGACINAGKYTLTVTGIGMYTGSKTATFNVLPYNINNDNVQIKNVVNMGYDWDPSTYEPIFYVYYTGSDITFNAADVEVAIRVNYSYTNLTPNTDFTISIDPSPVHDVGNYTLNVNGEGNYTGTKSLSFSVVYSAPHDITVTNTATTATLTWSDENTPLRWEVEYRIYDLSAPHDIYYPFEIVGIVSSDTKSITLTGLIPESEYMVRVRGIYSDSQSQWSYERVMFETSTKITIGESESGTEYLPTTTDSLYAVSQQIYTASEIGQAGTIATIEFLSDVWGDNPITRNVDVYMVHTNKTAFADDSDWISVTGNDKVFSGEVGFYSWTTIILSTPFSYNGSDNLAIIVHDKTGSTDNSTPFGCFATESNQALFVSGSTDYDLTSMSGVTGTLASSKNQIRLLMPDKIISTAGNWNVDANWNPSGVPTSSDVAIVNANVTIPSGCIAQASIVSVGNGSLTIEEGGQLICSNAAPVTVKKTIGAWTTAPVGGWYFIASPLKENLMPSEVNNMLTDEVEVPYSFDLYRLNGTTWENYHQHNDGGSVEPYYPGGGGIGGGLTPINPGGSGGDVFYLKNGIGYLYANASAKTLSFTGSTKPYNANYYITLSEGFNLVGNPYTFDAYINGPYYKMNASGTAVELVTDNAAIAPCTGVVVEAESTGNVTFTKSPASETTLNNGFLNITVAPANLRASAGSAAIDKAIVSFNKGNQLGKFYFGTQAANLYIPQGTEEYAIANAEAQGEMPVNFKANQDGQYTITVSPEGVEMSYLHLVDNMTGADVDLLALRQAQGSASYTFTAKTTDYESRFRVVFSICEDANGDNDSFAFISNGEIRLLVETLPETSLQMVDMMGRVVVSVGDVSGDVSGNVSTNGIPTGVYVLRLINGNNVKTQKIVVK